MNSEELIEKQIKRLSEYKTKAEVKAYQEGLEDAETFLEAIMQEQHGKLKSN
jgi:hypothetical protein